MRENKCGSKLGERRAIFNSLAKEKLMKKLTFECRGKRACPRICLGKELSEWREGIQDLEVLS